MFIVLKLVREMILILESNSQFVFTHRCSYETTSFEKEQFIALLSDVLLSANNKLGFKNDIYHIFTPISGGE